jgi:pimeloyl-ACP methyl ester carboxylesterase
LARGRERILALIGKAQSEFKIDPKKVYLVGYSDGGQLTTTLANPSPGPAASIAIFGADLPTPDNSTCLQDSRTPPIMIMAGTDDPISSYNSGKVSIFGFQNKSTVVFAPATAEAFARRNGIGTPPSEEMFPNREIQHRCNASPGGRTASLMSLFIPFATEGTRCHSLYFVIRAYWGAQQRISTAPHKQLYFFIYDRPTAPHRCDDGRRTASINVRRREQLRRAAGNRFAFYRTAERVPDKNESKRKGERMCANFAHARRHVETPALSVQSIIGATPKDRLHPFRAAARESASRGLLMRPDGRRKMARRSLTLAK